MRAKEFIAEQNTGSLAPGVEDAMPATYALTDLKSQDPYLQYRFGLALASARAKADGDVSFASQSKFGENMIVVARSEEEQKTLAMALALFGTHNASELISTKPSSESSDTYKTSPVLQYSRKLRK